MTITTPRCRRPQLISPAAYRRNQSFIPASLKASLRGGIGIFILLLISLIPVQFLAYLLIPGFLVVCLSTGLLAGVFAGDRIGSSRQGGQAGWMAGFWAGIYGGIVAIVMAAAGILMPEVGQGVVTQFTPGQLEGLAHYGLPPNTIALAGRVFGALIIYGVVGSLISGLVGSMGGMIYAALISSTPRRTTPGESVC